MRQKNGYICRPNGGDVAQLVEQRTENPCVGGSIPSITTSEAQNRAVLGFFFSGIRLALKEMNPLSVSTIWLSYTLLFFGIFSYFSPKERLARALLFGSALSMAVGYAFSFDFLWPWDERFHALVAKNLVNHPFKPTLYNATPYQDFEHSFWNVSHVWLHKQPFFSWLMALSIKFFGPTSWSPRLPSVLLLALASMAALRIGSITLSKRAGLSAFLLVGFSPYLLGLISGEIKLDHNDSIFFQPGHF